MPQQIKAFLLNFSSPQIYTTTLPEAHAASAFDVLEAIDRRESDRKSLMELSRWLKGQLRSSGFRVGGDAHILGVEIGDATSAVETARRLFSKGIFVLPARYPTVPLDKAILRVSLTTLHNQEDGAMFVEALKESYEASS
jgi:8-amino-7-oxononanoate synthase